MTTSLGIELEFLLLQTLAPFATVAMLDVRVRQRGGGFVSVIAVVGGQCLIHRRLPVASAEALLFELCRLDGERICEIADQVGALVRSPSGDSVAKVSSDDLSKLACKAAKVPALPH